MKEESKKDYLARHRRSLGFTEEEEETVQQPGLAARVKGWLYLILLLGFVWIIYQVFGMMNSN